MKIAAFDVNRHGNQVVGPGDLNHVWNGDG